MVIYGFMVFLIHEVNLRQFLQDSLQNSFTSLLAFPFRAFLHFLMTFAVLRDRLVSFNAAPSFARHFFFSVLQFSLNFLQLLLSFKADGNLSAQPKNEIQVRSLNNDSYIIIRKYFYGNIKDILLT